MNNDIKFEIDIEANARTVFDAFTTKKGVQGWWTGTCEINCITGQDSFIRFEKTGHTEEMGFSTKEVADPERLVWLCFSNNVFSSWVGTELRFEIKKRGSGSRLIFTQQSDDPDWGKHADYLPSTGGWDFFMRSLKNYCETGTGDPWVL